MNSNIQNLFGMAGKESRIIIGLMSGTSLDGLDVALCKISGAGSNTNVSLIEFETISYSDEVKTEVRTIFAREQIDFQKLVLLNEWLGITHAKMVLSCLTKWGISASSVDIIASHGQTVFHSPKTLHKIDEFPNGTMQIGDGDHIAVHTGVITISDFRQKHLAAGGEGAPLAVYGDYFLFGKRGENRILLNIGGISNFTYIPASMQMQDVFVTDTGTGNTLIDAYTRHYYPNMSYDKDAQIASTGTVCPELLNELINTEFFGKPFPKSTGPELFSMQYVQNAINKSNTTNISPPDLLATLTRFTAETIANAILINIPNHHKDTCIYISGGGAHNPLLTEWLQELLPYDFKDIDTLGISSDAKEAVLFAILANETVAGGNYNFGKVKGIPEVCMGKISLPS